MPGTTPSLALPYPTGTDRVMDGDNAIQALALAVETDLGRRLRFNPLTTSIFNGATTASDITALVPSAAACRPRGQRC